jgi:hypothetical protein
MLETECECVTSVTSVLTVRVRSNYPLALVDDVQSTELDPKSLFTRPYTNYYLCVLIKYLQDTRLRGKITSAFLEIKR